MQEQGKLAQALDVVTGVLGESIQMEEERNFLKAELMVVPPPHPTPPLPHICTFRLFPR
jgi:hypothetical protein